MPLEKDVFGITKDGISVDRYTLRNGHGATARLITYGATVTELWMPDRQGNLADLVLGFDELAHYETHRPYFGTIVGRVASRIAKGELILDGETRQLALNNGPHHLHGGTVGFSFCVWRAEPISTDADPAIKLTLRSPDGDQGYPGTLDVEVVYTLTEDDELRIDYTATTDRPTPVNLTHHGYFNLAGAGRSDILEHILQLDADRWLPAEPADTLDSSPSKSVPTVDGTPYDFRAPTALGTRIDQTDIEPKGYDLYYFFTRSDGRLHRVATLDEPTSGRSMDVLTTEPGVVLYTANYLDGSLPAKGDAVYAKHAGVCLETGHPPDAVHHPHFPSTILQVGQTYRHTCVYRFSVK